MDAVKIFSLFIGVIILIFLELLIGTWLWGIIAVGIFGLPVLTPLQFFGLEILLGILLPSPSGRITRILDTEDD